MPTFVSDLAPTDVWSHFDELLRIPRGSGSEAAVRSFVRDMAESRGLTTTVDDAGNLLVRKPASTGHEAAPVVVLQSHLDMVQEKNAEVEHDFASDPIRPVRDGDWLSADGTTLGADNGLGVAAMLALIESRDVAHGPLELLFTVDEETGLSGARALSNELLDGRLLINLDSEEEGTVTIGCAGGGDSTLHLRIREASAPDGVALTVSVAGLKGGHSGVDIHLQRGNAIRVLVRALRAAADATGLRVAAISGGNARNAIPREASAMLFLGEPSEEAACRSVIEESFTVATRELARSDPEMRFEVATVEAPDAAWDDDSTRRALDLLNALPHGVMAMSLDLPGLVETSVNLAVVRPEDGRLFVRVHSRSSMEGSLEVLRRRIRSIGELAGAEVSEGPAYPAWQPDVESRLLDLIRAAYEQVIGEPPEIGAMHAGLECGIIGEKYEGMDMVSFGPQIEFPHSPDERVRIGSVAPFYDVLCRTLERVRAPHA
ncbi:MAG TPA: aminoacyl-histidine dipeptidase [Gemmatimonadota bacterium]|nr:aminoacyl-histidine dipeptidase [Gemmatimonadota bacterium]